MNWRLKMALLRRRVPFYETAREAGLSRTILSHLVLEIRPPRPEEREALARVLGVSEVELFPGDDSNEAKAA